MKKSDPRQKDLACSFCGYEKAVRYMPKEINRQLFHEEITVPAEPEPKKLKVAILRITYQRDYFCPTCGHQWSKTYTMESQQHV